MKSKKLKKNIAIYTVGIVALLLVCWDLATTEQAAVDKSTFKLESEFDAITAPTTPVKVAVVPSDYSGLTDPVSRTTNPTYEQIEAMVRKAVELQGGFDGVIDKGDTVMIKVNLVGGNSPSGQGENTDVRVVKALIKTIYDFQNDIKIIVAEGTARTNDDYNVSGSVWHNSGYVPLLTDAYLSEINLSFLNLNQTINDLIEIDLQDDGTAYTHDFKYKVHKNELEADVYISVPVLKIHGPGITNALKNQIGTAPGCYYGYNKNSGGTSYYKGLIHEWYAPVKWTTEEIVDLSNISGIDFVVVDAIMCLESGKTYTGNNQVRFNTIVAGIDPVAVDHVCAKIFCLNPDDIAHITLAAKVGLGYNNPDYIQVVGATIDQVKKKVKKTSSATGKFGQSNRTWLLSSAFNGTDITVKHIPNEESYIPTANIDGWSEPVYFFDDRIDLYSYYQAGTNIITYAFTKFYAPVDQVAELYAGTHEAIYIYLNETLIYSFTSTANLGNSEIGDKVKTINIKEGQNTLLVKTLNTFGDYTFSLNICEVAPDPQYEGNRVNGLKFYTGTLTTQVPIHSVPDIYSKNLIQLENYPNPVTDFTTFKFSLPKSAITKINIYDLNGKLIKNLTTNYFIAGTHEIGWHTENLKAGYYICTLDAGKYSKSIKILLK